MDLDIKELQARHADLLNIRKQFDPDYRELAAQFLPMGFRDVSQQALKTGSRLVKRPKLNSTGQLAMRDFAFGMNGGITPSSRPWFSLRTKREDYNNQDEVKIYLDNVTDALNNALNASNFYKEVSTFYKQIGTFGTAVMLYYIRDDNDIYFTTLACGEYCIDVDRYGVVDTLFRTITYTVRQLVDDFGEENVPDLVKNLYKKPANWSDVFIVTHAIYPRDNGVVGGPVEKKPYASVYYIDGGLQSSSGSKSGKTKILRESGFDYNPILCARWSSISGDIYGEGPGGETLADSRLIQQMTSTVMRAVHKEVDPPMVAPSGYEDISLVPGAVNPVNALLSGASGSQIYPAINVKFNIEPAFTLISQKEEGIRRGLYNDLFRAITDLDRRNITATEINERSGERQILLGPILEILETEFLVPLIDGVFYALNSISLMPEAPDILEGQDLDIVFISILAQAQKATAVQNIDETVSFVANLGQIYPEALDTLNVDGIVDLRAEAVGTPVKCLKTQDERNQIRQQRQQQMQAEAEAQQAAAGLEAIHNAGVDINQAANGINDQLPATSPGA